jgi:hypothetical protein
VGPDNATFPYFAYLNALSVVDVMRPEVFYFHHHGLPSGIWCVPPTHVWQRCAPQLLRDYCLLLLCCILLLQPKSQHRRAAAVAAMMRPVSVLFRNEARTR